MRLAALVLERLQAGPITDLDADAPYSTTRLAGDGVIEVTGSGDVTYASPNAVNIMRLAGIEGALVGSPASALPGGASAVTPVLGTGAAREMTIEVRGRSLRYRTIALAEGALVLVEDVTDARRREQELRVKEATIREVHHRVKNNLQTIASPAAHPGTPLRPPRRPRTRSARRWSGCRRWQSCTRCSPSPPRSRWTSSAVVRTVVDMVGRSLIGPRSGHQARRRGRDGPRARARSPPRSRSWPSSSCTTRSSTASARRDRARSP